LLGGRDGLPDLLGYTWATNRYTVTFMADPTHPRDYAFTAGLSREQWAWEFLRRNPDCPELCSNCT